MGSIRALRTSDPPPSLRALVRGVQTRYDRPLSRKNGDAGAVCNRRMILAAAILVLGGLAGEAWAWGPATHIKLASDLLAQLQWLPAGVAAVLAAQRRHYLFGNVAADVVLAKRWSRVKQFCHHWQTGFAILDDACSDAGKAFAWGYLSHLAADTVAHNKFLPRQMTVTRTTMSFGHLYWELRADTTIGPYHWQTLRDVMTEAYREHECSLSARMTDTFLPFSLNWRLFYRMNRFVSRAAWLRAMYRWADLSRWQLSDQLMREYRAESLGRMMNVLTHGHESEVLRHDPNGNASLAYTRMQRRQLRQMARAGLNAPHVFYEAQVIHGPTTTLGGIVRRSASMVGSTGHTEATGPVH